MKARRGTLVLALATTALLAGCGSTASPGGHSPAPEAPRGGSAFLDTSATAGTTTWAVIAMGGPVATENNFWQLFVRPAGDSTWRLATPPGVADNGGLVLSGQTAQQAITGFRPSQYLTFTPLTQTRDTGRAWSSVPPLPGALADTPDALAAAPTSGDLLALLTTGTAKIASPGYSTWSALATQQQVATTTAGRRCGVRKLTAATFTPAGTPLIAAACSHAGVTGIFARLNRSWAIAGPQLPLATNGQAITISRLTRTERGVTAIIQTGAGDKSALYAAQSDGAGRWTLSQPFRLRGSRLASASFGPDGTIAVLTTSGAAATNGATGQTWHALPNPPARTATLALDAAGAVDAFAVNGSTLTIWQVSPGEAEWHRTQVIRVPIQYGSSG